ncbi:MULTISPECIES: epoxide hydrolase family protein [unclassified Mycolicibacterium]|uniref:epoxide hydrolase family protein n=1 Tax=unclassified Mycolicibacterium TaxID=2636767 RepID=UPI0012DDA3D1|nr:MULTISPECIES: epoxide hydrolase family protein [unclassified Mycolicibacterium]
MQAYQIEVSDDTLSEAVDRIRSTRWSAITEGDTPRYGASVTELRSVLRYWAEDYDWRLWERKLNAHPQFTAPIDGVDGHFWHIRSQSANGIPLLLVHGWPGAVVEFWDLIEPLSAPESAGAPDAPAFDVVIVELPGFGFSGKPREPGWGLSRIADFLHSLMHDVLGYQKYVIHGTDWGSLIAGRTAQRHPDHVEAIQIAMPYAQAPEGTEPDAAWESRQFEINGFDHVQSNVPDALTVGMADSPLALAAWVLEKYRSWSDCDGDLLSIFDIDQLVTILNFYWLESAIISSTRLYREVALENEPMTASSGVSVPTGIIDFPKEPFASPRDWVERAYNVQRWTSFPSGGHFGGLEQPKAVLSEIREFFPKHYGATSD